MRTVYLLTVILMIRNVISIKNMKKSANYEQLGYNPAELLAQLLDPNTTESKEFRYRTIEPEKTRHQNANDDTQPNDDFDIDKEDLKRSNFGKGNQSEIQSNNNDWRLINKGLLINSEDTKAIFVYDDEPRSAYKRSESWEKKQGPHQDLREAKPEYAIQNPFSHNLYQYKQNTVLEMNGNLRQYGFLPERYPFPTGANLGPVPGGPFAGGPNKFGLEHYGYLPPVGAPGLYPGYPPSAGSFIPRQVASDAFEAILEAFSSIAQNDDYQCVPRLLCETAGGAVGSNKILESVSTFQPLLAMLANYQGISTSPLFLFGRAVFLGMTSKGNPSSCRYAYPQCPNDPDELVHYLNNHKGGFFRFFSNKIGKKPVFQNKDFQSYGLYQPQTNPVNQAGYDLYKNKNYGEDYSYNNNTKILNDSYDVNKAMKINSRIQNKPSNFLNDNADVKSKWIFPDDIRNDDDSRIVKELKFPSNDDYDHIEYDFETPKDYVRKGKTILFPEWKDDRYTKSFNYNQNNNYGSNTKTYEDDKKDYVFDYVHNFYVKIDKQNIKGKDDEEGVKTVYVVRGNGDPRHPEVVKLRPGQHIQ